MYQLLQCIAQIVFICAITLLIWLPIWYLCTKGRSSVELNPEDHPDDKVYKVLATKMCKDRVRHQRTGHTRDRTTKTKRTIPKHNISLTPMYSGHRRSPPDNKPKAAHRRTRSQICFRARDRTHKVIIQTVPKQCQKTKDVKNCKGLIIAQGLSPRNIITNVVSYLVRHIYTCVVEFISNRVYRKLFISASIVGLLYVTCVQVKGDYGSFLEDVILLLPTILL